jgi:RNase P/RNase MRP subunit POP5
VNIPIENKRKRYICFQVKTINKNKQFSKEDINQELKSQCFHLFNTNCYKKGIRLIRFEDNTGIVKCMHTDKEDTIKLLNSIKNISSDKVNVETFGTSGTIKALIKKHMT